MNLSQQEMTALLEISRKAVSLDTKPLLGLILDQLRAVVEYQSSAVVALNGIELKLLAFRGPHSGVELEGWRIMLQNSTIARKVIRRKEPIIIDDIWANNTKANKFRQIVGEQLELNLHYGHSWMGIPLTIRDSIIGMLALIHSEPNYYTTNHAERVTTFAHQTAVALENDRLYQQVHHLATQEERSRLAREMHDQLAQALGYINVKASIISELLATGHIDEAQTSVQELKQIARDTYTDVREEIFNLRTKLSDDEKFLPSLREYLAKYEQHHEIVTHLVLADEALAEFSAPGGTQIIRIIQEALHNVRKHAQAKQVVIKIEADGNWRRLSIEDDGQGFDLNHIRKTNNSFGLQIMRERAESVGGTVEIDTVPGDGTRLIVRLPTT